MSGLVNFASEIGLIFAIVLLPACYLGAGMLFLRAGWGFWRQAQPDNPYRGRPWVPIVSLLVCGMLASFPTLLNRANVTGGSTVVVGMTPLVSYTPVTSSVTVLGATPGATVVNVVALFQVFFQAFGAMCCLFAVWGWHAAMVGRSNRRPSGCGVQFVFGIMLINVLSISRWLVAILTT